MPLAPNATRDKTHSVMSQEGVGDNTQRLHVVRYKYLLTTECSSPASTASLMYKTILEVTTDPSGSRALDVNGEVTCRVEELLSTDGDRNCFMT